MKETRDYYLDNENLVSPFSNQNVTSSVPRDGSGDYAAYEYPINSTDMTIDDYFNRLK